MKIFINKHTGNKWIANDCDVKTGDEAWYIKSVNVSLPKASSLWSIRRTQQKPTSYLRTRGERPYL